MKFQKIIAIGFVFLIFAGGVLSAIVSPKEIVGGFVRGYLNSSQNENILRKIGNGFLEFENRVNNYFIFHDQSINAYGLAQRTIGKNLVEDVDKSYEVVKLNNGYLTFKQTGDTDLSSLYEYIRELNKTCKTENIDLMYVNILSKNTTDKNLLPDNYPYIFSDNTEEILDKMKNEGISVLNMNTVIEEENIDKYSLFFKTDHHWTPKAGIWASGVIVNEINNAFDNYNLNAELYNLSLYNIETFKKSFLGTQGSRVGKYYSTIDDFDIITPKNETDYSLKIEKENVSLQGSFEDVFIHREHLTPEDLLNSDTTAYEVYMEGNHSLIEIENKSSSNDKKALVVMDSYGCVVAPYLSQAFSKLDCIDLRHYTEPLDQYIKNSKPDVVIYMCSGYQ